MPTPGATRLFAGSVVRGIGSGVGDPAAEAGMTVARMHHSTRQAHERTRLVWPFAMAPTMMVSMSHFDEDTSIMRHRLAITPIQLRRPRVDPQTRARGIAIGTILGAIVWVAAAAAALLLWKWLT